MADSYIEVDLGAFSEDDRRRADPRARARVSHWLSLGKTLSRAVAESVLKVGRRWCGRLGGSCWGRVNIGWSEQGLQAVAPQRTATAQHALLLGRRAPVPPTQCSAAWPPQPARTTIASPSPPPISGAIATNIIISCAELAAARLWLAGPPPRPFVSPHVRLFACCAGERAWHVYLPPRLAAGNLRLYCHDARRPHQELPRLFLVGVCLG